MVAIYGPKGAGKSQVAQALHERYGVVPVDPDEVVLDLLSRGAQPHPTDGWLMPVEQAVLDALRGNRAVSVEATGAWTSDWQLARDVEATGVQVLRIWVCSPLQTTLDRLARRTSRKAQTTVEEARSIYQFACDQARNQWFDLRLDTGRLHLDDLPAALFPLAASLTPDR